MIDEKGNKMTKAEVSISVDVDVSDCDKRWKAERRTDPTVDRISRMVKGHTLTDWWEVFHDDYGDTVEPDEDLIDDDGNKVNIMEVNITFEYDVSDCKTVREAERKGSTVAKAITGMIAPYKVTDYWTTFRDDRGDIIFPKNEPVRSNSPSKPKAKTKSKATSKPKIVRGMAKKSVGAKTKVRTGKTSAKAKKPVRKPVNAKSKPKTGTNPSKTKKTAKRPVSAKRTATARRVTKR